MVKISLLLTLLLFKILENDSPSEIMVTCAGPSSKMLKTKYQTLPKSYGIQVQNVTQLYYNQIRKTRVKQNTL